MVMTCCRRIYCQRPGGSFITNVLRADDWLCINVSNLQLMNDEVWPREGTTFDPTVSTMFGCCFPGKSREQRILMTITE